LVEDRFPGSDNDYQLKATMSPSELDTRFLDRKPGPAELERPSPR
jgi:hypothetical protein